MTPYQQAQHALAELKTAVVRLLEDKGSKGLKNVQIGKALGMHAGHVGHVGHIPRTILSLLESEGVARQDPTSKLWRLRRIEELGEGAERND